MDLDPVADWAIFDVADDHFYAALSRVVLRDWLSLDELEPPFHTGGQRILAISSRAVQSLRSDQLAVIERSCRILPLDVPTIELAGGSVRCMIAGVHLDRRPSAREASDEAAAAVSVSLPVTADR